MKPKKRTSDLVETRNEERRIGERKNWVGRMVATVKIMMPHHGKDLDLGLKSNSVENVAEKGVVRGGKKKG